MKNSDEERQADESTSWEQRWHSFAEDNDKRDDMKSSEDFDINITLGLILVVGILLTTVVLVSNTAVMAHNSPLNTYENLSFSQLSDNTTQATMQLHANANSPSDSSQFGWTYGNPSRNIVNQTQYNIPLIGPIIAIGYTGILAALFILAIFSARYCRQRNFGANIQISFLLVCTILFGYVLGIIVTFNLHPHMHYIDSTGKSISQWWSAHPSFYTLLFLQGSVLAVTGLIWSQPITIDQDKKDLDRHMNNWRSFGSWIGTFFGIIGLSAALAFINNVTDFGGIFIRHIIVLFGILVSLSMGFVIYKLRTLE